MTPEERTKHEFLLLQGKLDEDAQFFHFDKCPDILGDDYQLTFDMLYWAGVNINEVVGELPEVWYSPKEVMRRQMILLCNDAKKKIDSIIEILDKEKPDAKTKNIGEHPTGQ